MGHRVGGDIVLALQGVRVLSQAGQRQRRRVDDLEVTLAALTTLAIRAEHLEPGQEES